MSWRVDCFDGSDSEESVEEMEPPTTKRKKTRGMDKDGKQNKEPTKTRRRVVLNKAEKKSVATHILALKSDEVTLKCLANSAKQLAPISDSVKLFCESLNTAALLFLTHVLSLSAASV